jgi:hypothetical protein
MSVVWFTVAGFGLILMLIALWRIVQSLRPSPELKDLPVTPLEKLGWIGLAVTSGVIAGLAILVSIVGVDGFEEQPGARLTFWLLLMAALGVWTIAWLVVKRRNGTVVIDERDRAILARSFSVESMLVLLSLVAWTVGLTEVFWEEGAVPIPYLQLLFWTTFIGGAMGRSLGIVLGYRREIPIDA